MRIALGGSAGSGPVGKVLSSLFFSIFVVAGLWLTALLARSYLGTVDQYTWSRTSCTVESAKLVEQDAGRPSEPYLVRIAYLYEAGGRRSATYERSFADVGDAQRLWLAYPEGATVDCYVDRDAPERSTLRRGSLLWGLIVLFPLLFVAAGGVPLFLLWRRRPAAPETATPAPQALSEPERSPRGAYVLIGSFFGLFMLAGLGVLWWLLGAPLRHVLEARAWVETPCTVLASAVRSHAGDHGATYSIDILYRYAVGGRELRSNRYDFTVGSSSGEEAKQAIVDRHPVGSSCTCWVDPDDPTRAVLDRSFRRSYWSGLLGLPFFLVGAGGLWFLARSRRRAQHPVAVAAPTRKAAGAPLALRPKAGPWKKLLQSLIVNLLWNGLVGVFAWALVGEWRRGSHEWMPILLVSFFGLIGLLLLAALPYSLLALANPRPFLELERDAVVPGEELAVRYRLRGRASRLERLRFMVEGEERVRTTTRSGNSVSVNETAAVFHRQTFHDTAGGPVLPQGEARLRLPPDTMHSLAAPHNEVRWKLRVSGEIRRWPDLEEEFPLAVLPPETSG